MRTIWKFPLTGHVTDIEMPGGAQILCVQSQGEGACLWALVEPDNEKKPVRIRIFGTGHPVDDEMGLQYIDTFQLHGGSLVFHVFSEEPPK